MVSCYNILFKWVIRVGGEMMVEKKTSKEIYDLVNVKLNVARERNETPMALMVLNSEKWVSYEDYKKLQQKTQDKINKNFEMQEWINNAKKLFKAIQFNIKNPSKDRNYVGGLEI